MPPASTMSYDRQTESANGRYHRRTERAARAAGDLLLAYFAGGMPGVETLLAEILLADRLGGGLRTRWCDHRRVGRIRRDMAALPPPPQAFARGMAEGQRAIGDAHRALEGLGAVAETATRRQYDGPEEISSKADRCDAHAAELDRALAALPALSPEGGAR